MNHEDGRTVGESAPSALLSRIIQRPLTAENIGTYHDEALHQVIVIADTVTSLYLKAHPEAKTLFKKEIEDLAFEEEGLEAIPEILSHIGAKKLELQEVETFLAERTQELSAVILPPDRRRPLQKSGAGTYEEKEITDRLTLFIYMLKGDGIDIDTLKLTAGELRDDMMRKASYVSVEIDSLNRLALICDEEGNAGYVFDIELLTQEGLTVETVLGMTKNELNTLLAARPLIGERFVHGKNWMNRIRHLLYSPIGTEQEREEVRAVSRNELDPWKGFYLAPDGKHYSSVHYLVRKLKEEGFGAAQHFIDARTQNMQSIEIVNLNNRTLAGYAYEDILETLGVYKLPKVDTEGLWKGFVEIEGVRYGIASALVSRLGITQKTVLSAIEGGVVRKKQIRDVRNQETTGYAYDDVEALLFDIATAPQVAFEGEWAGFYEKDNEHYGSFLTIAEKMGTSRMFVREHIGEHSEIRKVQGRNVQGKLIDLYSYEQIQDLLKERLKIPAVATEGEWKNFYESEGKHYGSAEDIAKKLHVTGNAIMRDRVKALSLKPKQVTKINKVINAYAFEDIKSQFPDRESYPVVELQKGEWIGFYEHEGEHYGSVHSIAEKLGVTDRLVRVHIADAPNLRSQEIIGFRNRLITAYSYEQLKKLFGEEPSSKN